MIKTDCSSGNIIIDTSVNEILLEIDDWVVIVVEGPVGQRIVAHAGAVGTGKDESIFERAHRTLCAGTDDRLIQVS